MNPNWKETIDLIKKTPHVRHWTTLFCVAFALYLSTSFGERLGKALFYLTH